VIEALSKDFLNYINVQNLLLLDENGTEMKNLEINENLDSGQLFRYNSILTNEKKAGSVQVDIIDPNTNHS